MKDKKIRRIYVEKKAPFITEAESLLQDLKTSLGIGGLTGVRVVNRYDISGITSQEYAAARTTIFSEPPVDKVYDEELPLSETETVIAVEYLPGQYDQRADSAAQCIQITTLGQKPVIAAARLMVLQTESPPTAGDLEKIKNYLINPVDSREARLEKPGSLQLDYAVPDDVDRVNGFTGFNEERLEEFRIAQGLAMSLQDLAFCRDYFRDTEARDPFITEIKLLDTYWSDHCRHTTFQTRIREVDFQDSPLTAPIRDTYQEYLDAYLRVHAGTAKENDIDTCLMNIATMSMKALKKSGRLEDMEVSGEVNACSIIRDVTVDGKKEEWLVMFKNETHNHPTEIEPYGGAATCLGGAIRDPLSGRAFVYQAMRVTGSGNPLIPIRDTLPGKLPQRKITTEAAHGYSSYGNQIGVPTGQVTEIYHDGYVAKRMEVGAVMGAVPRKNVLREEPVPGDVILLVGGRTGRDGIGGATGSSKEHTEDSIHTAGAEVQKGNPPEERKLQRLYRNPDAAKLIKKSNDFGAGGVSVAIGELADGLEIFLDRVPKKYEGLDGTELAISESQERMAVVVTPQDAETFIKLAHAENLEAVVVARVTQEKRLKMVWRDTEIVNIGRDFIDTNGVRQETGVTVIAPTRPEPFSVFSESVANAVAAGDLKTAWIGNLTDLNTGSQRGLVERFDSNVGGLTVLMPFGGAHQHTPTEAMAAKVPVLNGETTTATLMSFGFNPQISTWSPFHGAVYAVVEAVAKIVATGGQYHSIRTSLQEYFEKPGQDKTRWGKPFSALLGAFHAMNKLGIAAIGGKDSMSGTFKDLDVPPTLICFAVDTTETDRVTSPEFKKTGSTAVYIKLPKDNAHMPRFDLLKRYYSRISLLMEVGNILAARTVRNGGIAAAVSEMVFGNKIGIQLTASIDTAEWFTADYGSFILEIDGSEADVGRMLKGIDHTILGHTIAQPVIRLEKAGAEIPIGDALSAWESVLEPVFPTGVKADDPQPVAEIYSRRNTRRPAVRIAKPRVLIPIFPGTNSEYESQHVFEKAGAVVDTLVLRNLTPTDIDQSLQELKKRIDAAQIVWLVGGFSAGDEPEGSGKFISAVFRNPHVKDAVTSLLNERDGLMLGVCNGFQALVKLGLVPYGEIRDLEETSPTLTFNRIGRHMSRMVHTKVVSVKSPWFIKHEPGETYVIPVSHGEGRFVATPAVIQQLTDNGQIATQYVDMEGNPSMHDLFNPNGSVNAIEGIASPDGRVLGKMGHAERVTSDVALNIPGNKYMKLCESGVAYFE